MADNEKRRLTEVELCDELECLTRMVRLLCHQADLRVEVLTEDRGYLRLTFSAKSTAPWGLQSEMPWLPGHIVRRVWDEELQDIVRITPDVDVGDDLPVHGTG